LVVKVVFILPVLFRVHLFFQRNIRQTIRNLVISGLKENLVIVIFFKIIKNSIEVPDILSAPLNPDPTPSFGRSSIADSCKTRKLPETGFDVVT
jgi:hypothetical protein